MTSYHAKQSELQMLKMQEMALNNLLQKCSNFRYKLQVIWNGGFIY